MTDEQRMILGGMVGEMMEDIHKLGAIPGITAVATNTFAVKDDHDLAGDWTITVEKVK